MSLTRSSSQNSRSLTRLGRSDARSSSQNARSLTRLGRSDARSYSLLTIDEEVTPSLVAKAARLPQTQLYTNFVLTAFPCYFKATENRVPINWVEYVERRRNGTDAPFDWAIRSLTAIYAGSIHDDQRCMDAGRELYTRALRGLSGLVSDVSTAKSDEALSTAIALAVFEMLASTSEDGWISHAHGIRALMRLRGPKAHRTGFGCALYIAYRNVLITSALTTGEECFFEEPEWQELNRDIAAENAKQPASSVYTEISERAFREVVKLPGYVKIARSLCKAGPERLKHERPMLLQDVLATRAALRGIHTEFSMSVSTLRAGTTPRSGFIGPVPHDFFDGFSKLSIQGIRSAILLLNYIIILLDPSQRRAAEAENRSISNLTVTTKDPNSNLTRGAISGQLTPPASPRPRDLMVKPFSMPVTRKTPSSNWMDQIALTMGMAGVRVSLIDE